MPFLPKSFCKIILTEIEQNKKPAGAFLFCSFISNTRALSFINIHDPATLKTILLQNVLHHLIIRVCIDP